MEWNVLCGLGIAAVGMRWIVRPEVPVGWDGMSPAFVLRGTPARAAGVVSLAIGMAVAWHGGVFW